MKPLWLKYSSEKLWKFIWKTLNTFWKSQDFSEIYYFLSRSRKMYENLQLSQLNSLLHFDITFPKTQINSEFFKLIFESWHGNSEIFCWILETWSVREIQRFSANYSHFFWIKMFGLVNLMFILMLLSTKIAFLELSVERYWKIWWSWFDI